jgi:hypothetical protein
MHIANSDHHRVVPMDAMLVAGNVNIDTIAFFEWTQVGNTVTSALIGYKTSLTLVHTDLGKCMNPIGVG